MGDHIRSKTKLGYHISTKIISMLLVLLLTTTAFSSIVVAQGPTDPVSTGYSTVGDVNSQSDGPIKGLVATASHKTPIRNITKELKELLKLRLKAVSSLSVVTIYNGIEKKTPLKRLLPTGIDVTGDGKNDIRIWVFRLPGIDLNPPAACIKTTLLVRRLNDDIKKGPFEIYLEYYPMVISNHTRIRMGYQIPAGEEVPKTCIVTHKEIPYLLYPKKEITHRIAINPVSIIGRSQLNLLFSIADVENKNVNSELTIQVNQSPAVRNEISFSLSKDHFIRRGQTLEISRKNAVASNVSLTIRDVLGFDNGSLTIKNLPKKITLSWLFAPKGHIELNTYGSSSGNVEANVNGIVSLGFKPETGVNFRLGWDLDRLTRIGALIGLIRGKSFDLTFDASASATLSNLYVNIPDKLGLTASLFSLNLKGGVDVGKVVLSPYPGADTVSMNVENADVVLKDCNINLVTVEPLTVSITYPQDGDTVIDVVTITGTASAPPSKTIKSVTISIDNGDSILVDGTTEWSYKWDTTALPNGNHTITAQSFDGESYSDSDTKTAIVNNSEHNWKPSVKITAPSNYQIVSGIINIAGAAHDADGDPLKVYLQITNILKSKIFDKDDVELVVDQYGAWSYGWDASNLTAGLYTIYVQSYDGKDYSGNDSVVVWVKLKCNLDFTLSEASINVTNLAINSKPSNLDISSFVLSGSGSVKVADGAIDADVSGSLNLKDFSALKKNETDVTKLDLKNLNADLSGYGEMILSQSQSEIGLEINGSVSLGFDSLYIADIPIIGALDLGAFALSGKGFISAGIKMDKNNIVIGGYGDRADVTIEATDLLLNISGQQQKYFLMGVDKIEVTGNGDISLLNNSIEVNGSLDKFDVDNFYIQGDLAKLAFSGRIDHTQDASLKIDFTNLSNFNISYDGNNSLNITTPKVVLQSAQGIITAFAGSITISRQGYAGFSYYKDDLYATCWLNISKICFTALSLSYNELSVYAGNICGSGSFCFVLSSVVSIAHGKDWINITIGHKGIAHIIARDAYINTDIVHGYLDVDIFLKNNGDNFSINVSGIPNNISLYMDGNAALDVNVFDLYLKDNMNGSNDLVNISIGSIDGSFVVHADEGVWTIDTTQGISVEKLYFTIFLKSAQTFLSINADSIETSGGGRIFIDRENKIISYISGDDTDKTISLVGLDVITSSLNVIVEEMNIALSGTDTNFSLSSSDNTTKLNVDFGTGAYVTLNTLWANILNIAEIRIHSLEMTAPLVATYVKGKSMPLTIETSGEIAFEEFSISLSYVPIINLYGGDIEGSDILVSVGITDDGGIKFYANGAVQIHLDTIILPPLKYLVVPAILIPDFNVSFGGKGTIILRGLGLQGLTGSGPIYFEGNVSEYTTFSFVVSANFLKKLQFIRPINEGAIISISVEPGNFLIALDELNLNDVLFSSTSLLTLDIKDPLKDLLRDRSISVKGHFEFHKPVFEDDFMSVSELKGAGFFKFSKYKRVSGNEVERYIALNGNGSGYISIENETGLLGLPKYHFAGQWYGGYLTIVKSVERFDGDSMTTLMFLLHDVDFDVMILRGGLIQLIGQIIDDTIGVWWQNIEGTWYRLWPLLQDPPLPPSKGFVTLINGQTTGLTEILPGYTIDFTAWYVPADMTKWTNSAPQSNPNEQSQPGSQQENQGEVSGQNNNGQGSAPLGYGQGQGSSQEGGQSGEYNFTLNYGDGNSQIFPVDYSDVPVPIKVDLGSHLYTSPGTYTATLTVSGDPDADEVAVDTLTIKVVEKYLDVSTSSLSFDYINVGSDGKIHGSFKISNLANANYSNGYVLDWSIIDKTRWGTNWTFEPSSGSLQPNRSQIVNILFTPPIVKGDYNDTDNGIIIVNNNDPTEMKIVNFSLNYGLIELFPQYPIVLYVDTGGTRTLENVFWVHRTRWEKNDAGVAWEVCESSFAPGMVTFIPDNGVIPKGKGPTPVDLRVTASDGVYKGTVKVCRVDDPSDNDTVDITLVVGMNGQLNIDLVHDGGDKLFESQPFTIHVSDADSAEDVPYATVTYQKYDESEMYETGITDNNGNVEFTSIGVSTSEDVAFCKVNVEATGYDSTDLYFLVWDSIGQIHGFVYDSVTEEGIGNALVTAEPGSYSAYTMPQGASKGRYVLRVPPGTYTVNASKDGYPSETVENVSVGPDGYFFLCFNLTPYNLPPVAEAGGRYSGYVNEPITFDGSESYDPDGSIAQYDWKWETMGDWEENITSSPKHTYTTPGFRTISLRVHDNGNSTDEDTAIVTVNKVLKINAPNSVNENEWFTVTVTKYDGSSILGCYVDFNGETKYAWWGTTSFRAPAVYMNVDELIHAWQELSDSEAFRYIAVINTN